MKIKMRKKNEKEKQKILSPLFAFLTMRADGYLWVRTDKIGIWDVTDTLFVTNFIQLISSQPVD